MTDTPPQPLGDEDQAIDAEFEPASAPASPRNGRWRPGWAVVTGVGLVAIISLLLAAMAFGLVPGLSGAGGNYTALENENQELRAQLDTAETERADLATRLQAIETRTAQQNASAQTSRQSVTNLATTVETVERDLARVRGDVDTLQAEPVLTQTVDPETGEAVIAAIDTGLQSRIEALEQVITQFPAAYATSPEQTDRLRAEIATLRADLTALQQAMQTADTRPPAGPISTRSDADIALALSAIEAAARRGRPFQSGYQRLAAAMPGEAAVLALEPIATTGALTLADLRDQFSPLVSRALDTEAASAGGAANLVRSIFGDGVTVRRAGQDNAADRLDTAQTYLDNGNLRAAIIEIESLPSDVQPVFTDWLDNARQRLSLEDALEALRLAMIAKDRP